jgi:hypothetical protein
MGSFFLSKAARNHGAHQQSATCVTSRVPARNLLSQWVRFFKRSARNHGAPQQSATCVTSRGSGTENPIPPQMGSFFQKIRPQPRSASAIGDLRHLARFSDGKSPQHKWVRFFKVRPQPRSASAIGDLRHLASSGTEPPFTNGFVFSRRSAATTEYIRNRRLASPREAR